jgi:hypothetical protein
MYLQEGTSIAALLKEKAAFLQTYKLVLGPHVVVLAHEDNISSGSFYCVVQEELMYKVSSLLEAVDLALKASFVFNIKYSDAAISSWMFLQRCIFGIETRFDTVSTKLNSLLIDTKKDLKIM